MSRHVNLAHLEFLTDDFGVWQHAHRRKIYRREGYALDDAARGLIVAAYEQRRDLAQTYLQYIATSCQTTPITNFFNSKRRALPSSPSADAIGETYWGIATCIAEQVCVEKAEATMQQLAPSLSFAESSLRGKAYILAGAVLINPSYAERLADEITTLCQKQVTQDWPWPEATATYANAILPYALIQAGASLGRDDYTQAGITLLSFLNTTCLRDGVPSVIGNNGWYPKGGRPALFDQQPIDASYQVIANLAAYTASHNPTWLREAERFFAWFWGDNPLGRSLIRTDESCADGLQAKGVSANRGAESTICFLIAQAMLERTYRENTSESLD